MHRCAFSSLHFLYVLQLLFLLLLLLHHHHLLNHLLLLFILVLLFLHLLLHRHFSYNSFSSSTSLLSHSRCKLAVGLLSGQYCDPSPPLPPPPAAGAAEGSTNVREQRGIRPSMFKTLVGQGHREFSSNRQQVGSIHVHRYKSTI